MPWPCYIPPFSQRSSLTVIFYSFHSLPLPFIRSILFCSPHSRLDRSVAPRVRTRNPRVQGTWFASEIICSRVDEFAAHAWPYKGFFPLRALALLQGDIYWCIAIDCYEGAMGTSERNRAWSMIRVIRV